VADKLGGISFMSWFREIIAGHIGPTDHASLRNDETWFCELARA
jgi:hypothetical protein